MTPEASLLTAKQAAILNIIKRYIHIHGVAPTLAELCKMTATKSVGSMSKSLDILIRKGFIERQKGGWRQLKLRDACPFCGRPLKKKKR